MSTARKGNKVDGSFQPTLGPMALEPQSAPVETPGNPDSVGCLRDAIDRSGMQDKVLVAATGVSKGYFSKMTNGAQPCRLSLLDELPDALVLDALDRMARQRGGRVVKEHEDVIVALRLVEVAHDFIRVQAAKAEAR